MAKAIFQQNKVETALAKVIAEKGYLCDEVRLLKRYAAEHKRDFRAADSKFRANLFRDTHDQRMQIKLENELPINEMVADARCLEAAYKMC
jgi:hypothetical protein